MTTCGKTETNTVQSSGVKSLVYQNMSPHGTNDRGQIWSVMFYSRSKETPKWVRRYISQISSIQSQVNWNSRHTMLFTVVKNDKTITMHTCQITSPCVLHDISLKSRQDLRRWILVILSKMWQRLRPMQTYFQSWGLAKTSVDLIKHTAALYWASVYAVNLVRLYFNP